MWSVSKRTFLSVFIGLLIMTSCKLKRPGAATTSETVSNRGANLSEQDMSQDYNEYFRPKYFAPEATKEDLDRLIRDLEAKYDDDNSMPDDLKYVTIFLSNLRPLRGMIWKLVPLFEAEKAPHLAALQAIRQMSNYVHTYLPTHQWDIGFDYLSAPGDFNFAAHPDTRPQDEASQKYWNNRYQRPEQFVIAVKNDIIPVFEKNVARLEELYNQKKTIVVDNRIFYGTGTFLDGLQRFELVGQTELAAVIASYRIALHDMYLYVSYQKPNIIHILSKTAAAVGWNAYVTDSSIASPSRAIVDTLRKYPNDFILGAPGYPPRDPSSVGQARGTMLKAWDNLRRSVLFARYTKQHIDSAPNDNDSLSAIKKSRIGGWTDLIGHSLDSIEATVYGDGGSFDKEGSFPTPLRSAVTGEVTHVDLRLAYTNPPADLKVFLPVGFETSQPELTTKYSNVQYKNYLYGRPTAWNYYVFQPYIKGAQNPEAMRKASRILHQNWGGFLAGGPLAGFLL